MIERTRGREKGADGSKARPSFINHVHSCPSVVWLGGGGGGVCVCVALIREDVIRWKNRTGHDMWDNGWSVLCMITQEGLSWISQFDQSIISCLPSLRFPLLSFQFVSIRISLLIVIPILLFLPLLLLFLHLEFCSPYLRLCLLSPFITFSSSFFSSSQLSTGYHLTSRHNAPHSVVSHHIASPDAVGNRTVQRNVMYV